MTRTPLPNRRQSITIDALWGKHPITISVGFKPKEGHPWHLGSALEVFADTSKGGDMQSVLDDACTVISLALQHGIAPLDLGKSLGTMPVMVGERVTEGPASPLGVIIAAIMQAAGIKA